MNRHSIKTSLFNLLDVLPSRIGYLLYHALQKRFTGSSKEKVDANLKSYFKSWEILDKNGGLTGKILLEIGSGWMPIMPYLFKYKGGAKKVFTYDINKHYDNKYIDELNTIVETELHVKVNYENGEYHIPRFVEYFPNSNVITSKLPDKVDLVFSRFVLEHVTPEDLINMHERFAKDLPEEALILHLISPSDHRAYSDKSLSHYDFLKYSEKQWNKIQTKFDYHNRMRLPQYLDIFDKTGFEVVHLEYDKVDTSSKKYEKFKQLKIHSDFMSHSEEELLAGSINVLLRKK